MKNVMSKSLIMGIIIGCLGTGSLVGASSYLKTIQVDTTPIQMVFDGTEMKSENIDLKFGEYFNGKEHVPTSMIYKGTTYVPIRLVAESFGKDVTWDGKNRVASFNQKEVKEEEPKNQGIWEGTIVHSMSYNQKEKGKIEFVFVSKNQMEKEAKLTFTSSQQFDYKIKNERGEELYNYAMDKMFLQAMSSQMIKQGEELTFTDIPNIELPAGNYTVDFQLTAQGYSHIQTFSFEMK